MSIRKREVFDLETAVKEINSWLEESDQLELSDDENIYLIFMEIMIIL